MLGGGGDCTVLSTNNSALSTNNSALSRLKNRESKKTRQGQHTQYHDGDENENVKNAIG